MQITFTFSHEAVKLKRAIVCALSIKKRFTIDSIDVHISLNFRIVR